MQNLVVIKITPCYLDTLPATSCVPVAKVMMCKIVLSMMCQKRWWLIQCLLLSLRQMFCMC